MPQAMAVIGAVTTVASTAASVSASRRAEKKQQQQERVATARSNRMAIREAQIRRAQSLNVAAQSGGVGGSGVAGGVASLGSQLGSGLGFSAQMSALSEDITKYTQKARLFGDIAGLGQMAYQVGGGWAGLRQTFAKKEPAPNRPVPYGGGR